MNEIITRGTNMKKVLVFLISMAFVVTMLVSCTNQIIQTPTEPTEQSTPESIESTPITEPTPTLEASPELAEQSSPKPPDIDTPYIELYAPIIEAYSRLEQSGYTISNEDFINNIILILFSFLT